MRFARLPFLNRVITEMQIKLEQIADIRTGYTFRSAVNNTPQGDVLLIQMSDLEALNDHKINGIKSINMKIRSPEWTLKEGDILIKARGTDFIPVIVQKELHGAVFTHPLLRLRLNRQLAIPEFIAWQMSQPNVQRQLHRSSSGTSVQMLNLQNLKELELDLPSLNQQQKIQEMVLLMKHEENLLDLLTAKRKQFICSSIKRSMHKDNLVWIDS